MRLSPIVLKLRVAETRFENRIGGAAELAVALKNTLDEEMAFVIQLSEVPDNNQHDTEVIQIISEVFSVVVALKNNISDSDKTGFEAYDKLYSVRTELFAALIGLDLNWDNNDDDNTYENLVSYAGAQLIDIRRDYLWYRFDFSVGTRITGKDDGAQLSAADLDALVTLYTQYILAPSAFDHIGGPLPVTIVRPDMEQLIDGSHGFDTGFSTGEDTAESLKNKL